MDKLIKSLEQRLNTKITTHSTPPQGMGSFVIFVTDIHGNEYAVKVSGEDNNDAVALKILQQHKVNIAVPDLIDDFEFEGKRVVVMERIQSTLFQDVPKEEMVKYIPSMVQNLKELHKVKSDKAGFLNSTEKFDSWKDFLLSRFISDQRKGEWNEIVARKVLDGGLIKKSISSLVDAIQSLHFSQSEYSLLHTDFNQRNLFVDSDSDQVSAIIDWGEATFGDPIYDFARIRMLIWHFDLGDSALKMYYDCLGYDDKQIKLDTLYWVFRVIEYLEFYSEEENVFNLGRIKLHEGFLREFDWGSLS